MDILHVEKEEIILNEKNKRTISIYCFYFLHYSFKNIFVSNPIKKCI